MIPTAKLERLLDRFHAIEAELASGQGGAGFVKLSKEHAELSPVIDVVRQYRAVQDQLEGAESMIADPQTDAEMRSLAEEERAHLKQRFAQLEHELQVQLLPKDAADSSSAILEIRAGTGGDEAALFADDLLSMYTRYCALQGWKTELMSRTDSDLGGIKDAVMEVVGQGVYAKLKFESGVHRVQRVPVTEAQGRIHTSAATVAVLPEAEDVDIVINDKDLRIDVYRAQGAGGQHVNKTESAVRITHLPTGIAVAQQTEKSQHKNKAGAMKMLKAKLYELERERVDSARASERKSLVGSGDRSERIRTYNFPQGRVTDHRINLTLYKLDKIISGDDLGEIVDALVQQDQADRLAAMEAEALTLDEAVNHLHDAGVDNPRLDARLLFEHAKAIELSALVAKGRLQDIFDRLIARRAGREPLAYITGHKEFWSLDFAVGPGVLIPRPDSETLIETALRLYPDKTAPLSILDLGTGSGCLLIAALKEFPNAHGIGIDSSPDALAWARRNLAAHRLEDRASLIETGWLEEASPGFDLILANPPYIPTDAIAGLAPEVAGHEPRAALDGGPDGLAAYRVLATRIARLLAPSGHALLEIGQGQGDAVATLLTAAGLKVPTINPDLAGISRVVVAKRDSPGR